MRLKTKILLSMISAVAIIFMAAMPVYAQDAVPMAVNGEWVLDNNESKEPSDERDNEQRTPAITYIAVVVAALSLAANVVLAVLLINEKKKSTVVPYDPSERTDFDIDILE